MIIQLFINKYSLPHFTDHHTFQYAHPVAFDRIYNNVQKTYSSAGKQKKLDFLTHNSSPFEVTVDSQA